MLLAVLAIIAGALSIYAYLYNVWDFWDKDPQRGAIAMPAADRFGDHFEKVEYLDQGWKAEDSLWYYITSLGSVLVPYDLFMVLEQSGSQTLFRDNTALNNYRYLPQKPTFKNPDGLPVGFVADYYKGHKFLGLTCAACHAGQVNYKGTAIRIDGGPALADMETMVSDLAGALRQTLADPAKKQRLIAAAMARGNYSKAEQVEADLETYARRVTSYVVYNHPTTPYRHGRLDAFGRIFNRMLEHVMSVDQLRRLLKDRLTAEEIDKVLVDLGPVLNAQDRDHLIDRLEKNLSQRQMIRLAKDIFNPPNAPVSYPFLWDTPHSDRVQWNGIGNNASQGPLGRNVGEVIGVFGTLDWQEKKGWTIASALGGQGWFSDKHIDFSSSVDVSNLRRLEHALGNLKSPQWPEKILGAIDRDKAGRGAAIYSHQCAICHAEIDRADPDRMVVVNMTRIDKVQTDPQTALNAVEQTGYSGILRDHYAPIGIGNILMQRRAPVAALLISATENVLLTPDPEHGVVVGAALRLYDFFVTARDNEIRPSLKSGNYDPGSAVDPLASLRAYKARPLNGIWATAPYLHNGSVPTLYDLLLPKKSDKDKADGEFRPDVFKVGSREFDPEKVGLKSDIGDPFVTEYAGNGNSGHEYGARSLSRDQKLDLIEYLKTL
jgi:cytochrome c5